MSGTGQSGGALHNPADDHTDIFGRSINQTPKQQPVKQVVQPPPVMARPPPQAKPDLFEPQYVESLLYLSF